MQWYNNLRMLYKILLPVAAALTLALAGLTWQIRSMNASAVRQVAEKELAALAGQYGNAVGSFFEEPLNRAQAIADALSQTLTQEMPVPRKMQLPLLNGLLKGNPIYMGTGVAWEPNVLDGKDAENRNAPGCDAEGRFIPYLTAGGLETLTDLETSNYYKLPKERNRTSLIVPFLYEVGGRQILMTTASAAIKQEGRFRGAVFIDLPLDDVGAMVGRITIYRSGWAGILTQEGSIIAHKDTALIGKNFFAVRKAENGTAARAALQAGQTFLEETAADGKLCYFYYYPITFPITGQTWYFVVSVPVAEVLAKVAHIGNVTVGVSLGVLILALLVIFLVVRAGVRPLGVLADAAKRIAGGDLKLALDATRFGGEVRELCAALSNMIRSLLASLAEAGKLGDAAREQAGKAEQAMRDADAARAMAESRHQAILAAAGRLEDVALIVSSASEKLSAQITRSKQGSAEQADRVGETAASMEQMNNTVSEVARNAGSASEVALSAKTRAEEGAGVVLQAVSGIRDVQAVSLALKTDMGKLAERAGAITNIMNVISDIADQTNLLALNAAIEAARAGDAGRGFAVVADEVRKLAEKTMASTKDVGGAIGSIQGSVTQSIGQVDQAVNLIEAATERANMSGEALRQIVSLVDNASDQVRAIATASEEQSRTSEEINRSIAQVNAIAVETAKDMQESVKSVTELVTQAQKLNVLIEEMKKA